MPVSSLVWLAVLPWACAFKNTAPVVIWSSHSSGNLDSLAARPTPFTQTSHFLDALLDHKLCQYDAVIIAEQPGLRASDLRTLSRTSDLPTRLSDSASSLQIPYLRRGDGNSFDEFKVALAERCGLRRVELDLGQGGVDLQEGDKYLVCVSMPLLEGEGIERKNAVHNHETQLSTEISHITSVLPTYLVIYAGSHTFVKRQGADPDPPSRPIVDSSSEILPAFAPINTTLPEGSLFQRYRFFTPGLITALLVVFGLLIPVLMVSIYALASIQSPLRMNAPKGPSFEKKNQ